MQSSEQAWPTKARFYSGVGVWYLATLLFMVYAFWPGLLPDLKQPTVHSMPSTQATKFVEKPKPLKIGKPSRIVVSRLGIDLPIADGVYNAADKSWTLNTKRQAYFALPTSLANDQWGNTLVYGHNNRFVFGPLRNLVRGDKAYIHTKKRQIFVYSYDKAKELKPNDTSIFDYDGPPMLTLQTCTGSWYEKRTMYHFNFKEVR